MPLRDRLAQGSGNWSAIMHLGNWLRSLGLERYEVALRDNAIDETIPSSASDGLF